MLVLGGREVESVEQVHHTKVMIVGSGGNGMAVAVLLEQAGFSDFLIVTKHDDFGGAWWQNTYPGCAVDGPISVYQFSFALNPEWPRLYAAQPELAAYMQKVAADHGLYEHTHFRTEMLEAEWLEEPACWSVTTTGGTYHAEVLVLATGFLEEAVVPDIVGMDSFQGRIFHSSMWPEGYTGEGDRVAVVGTGSSSIQIVSAMQQVAAAVTMFQRTPCWIVPKQDKVFSDEDRARFRDTPELLLEMRRELSEEQEVVWDDVFLLKDVAASDAAQAEALQYLEEQVPDPELRLLLTPDHRFACKRPGVSDTYYRALQQDNVELVPEAASRIGPTTIASAGGREFEADTVVLATGFFFGGHILHRVRRRDGVTVGEAQQGHPRAYRSISVSGCPNLFLIGGAAPNGQNWNGLSAGEIAGVYVVKALEYMQEHGIRALEVGQDAEAAWKREADKVLDASPMVSGGCANYSLDELGHNKAAWPGNEGHMSAALSEFDASVYLVVATWTDDRGIPAAN